jgi:D-glycero-alpha-D-manno-heptose 1-phosphate guanylyltransferase
LEAIILAGGLGTRLRGVIGESPKSMAPVNGRPFLEFLLDYLIAEGVTRVILSTGFKAEVITAHFGNRYRSLQVDYSHEVTPLGTGGGILKAMHLVTEPDVFTLNGDSLFRLGLAGLKEMHTTNRADITLALRSLPETGRYGSVRTDTAGRITGFEEKKENAGPGYINGGVYRIRRDFLLNAGFPEKFSLEKDCFEMKASSARFFGFPADGYFLDIGIPEDYERAQHEFK